MTYGRAILGDNQFLGVNHANQAKAVEMFERFKNPDAILEVIAAAYAAGVRDFMFTTHDRYDPVFAEIRRSNLFPGMYYSPCLPYAHKYRNQLSSRGLAGLLASTLMQLNPLRIVPASLGLLISRTRLLTALLVEIEILMCKGLPLRGVFLQNAATDFLLAMELHRPLEDFAKAVHRLGAEPGFITMNHPKAANVLTDVIGLDRPWVCSNYNMAGVRMNPSPVIVEASFASGKTRNIAMSVFSSGGASLEQALRHVVGATRMGKVDAILFGSSSPSNIANNAAIILGSVEA